MGSLADVPQEVAGHGLLTGKVVVVTAAAGTGIGFGYSGRTPSRSGYIHIPTNKTVILDLNGHTSAAFCPAKW